MMKKCREAFLLDLKKWLAKLYTAADEGLRLCIVHATLEHLFERKDIRKYFSDWQQDPVLAPAYKEACLWEGKTPLSRYNKQAKPAKKLE
jgi:DNA-binding transcriptional MerR regulator